MSIDHPPFDRLSELASGELVPEVAASIEQHVSHCASCRATLARLRAIIERAAALPASIEPPAQEWAALRGRLRQHTNATPRQGGWMREWGLRAAAAVVLVAGSSALTVVILRERVPADVAAVRGPAAVAAVPATVRAVDRSYADVLDELSATIGAQRGTLAPSTIATLEHTLRVIDEAIAEARAALAADPGNRALLDVLSANYEQKVQLLRRVSELPART
jgi:anti-sigma factor ChrR (cupin superfamily)